MFQAIQAIVLATIPTWFFYPPWPSSQEARMWGLEEASDAGRCVEVCWYIDGASMGCAPTVRTEDGMTICKEKMARTEGFEMALDLIGELARERQERLEKEMKALVDGKATSLLSQRKRIRLAGLDAAFNEIALFMQTLRERIESVPQEVKPAE